jgi:hypothetical protein
MSKIDEIEQALGREKTLAFIRFLLVELRGYYTHLVAHLEHSCRNESIYYAHKMQSGVAMFQASDFIHLLESVESGETDDVFSFHFRDSLEKEFSAFVRQIEKKYPSVKDARQK